MPPLCQPLSDNKRETLYTLWSATRLCELTESKDPLLQTVSIGLNETAARVEARELKHWLKEVLQQKASDSLLCHPTLLLGSTSYSMERYMTVSLDCSFSSMLAALTEIRLA